MRFFLFVVFLFVPLQVSGQPGQALPGSGQVMRMELIRKISQGQAPPWLDMTFGQKDWTHYAYVQDMAHSQVMQKDLKKVSNKALLSFIEFVITGSANGHGKRFPFPVHKKLLDIALSDKSPYLRSRAVFALGELESKDLRIQRPLAKTLNSPVTTPPLVRKAIALALGKIKPQDITVLEYLVLALLHDPKPFVRKAIALALGAINPEDSLFFRKLSYVALSDRNGGVQSMALSALRKITSHRRCSSTFLR